MHQDNIVKIPVANGNFLLTVPMVTQVGEWQGFPCNLQTALNFAKQQQKKNSVMEILHQFAHKYEYMAVYFKLLLLSVGIQKYPILFS